MDTFSADDFEQEDELFSQPGAEKLGIVGGAGVGKSYLFQAIVYRAYAGHKSGALAYYLERDSIRLSMAKDLVQYLDRDNKHLSAAQMKPLMAKIWNRARFIRKFQKWQRLPKTLYNEQQWYRLRLHYRMGLLGRSRSPFDIEFLDGSGEAFFEGALNARNRRLWREAYLGARIMVFCLPLWAAFPDTGLSAKDRKWRDDVLEGFDQVLQNYLQLRTAETASYPVRTILALTMADDRRSALQTLFRSWIEPYMDNPQRYLERLRRGSGVARYLANARQVSEALHQEFDAARDPRVSSIPNSLDLGAGRPWLIPVSAMEGARLEVIEKEYPNPDDRPPLNEPVPVHVELPLLVALCERDNALM